jgi:uncharacterized protein (DUF305 family)
MSSETAVSAHPVGDVEERARWSPDARTVALAAVLVAAIVAAVVLWFLWPRTPGEGSAEAGFLRDMSIHHDQAVQMALIIRDRTEDPQLQALATDIVLTQQAEIGTMTGWLLEWDLSLTSSEPAMSWMGHSMEGQPMPGMASPEEIQQLRDLPVPDAEVLFLRLMIRHHAAGIDMAQACLDRCDDDDVLRLSHGIVNSQEAEITTMQSMLAARGQEPEPVSLSTSD